MSDLVRFEHVTKDYTVGLLQRGRLRAVDDITFRIAPGEIVGLVGPNRAGKTTAVKLLLSLARPTEGTIIRFGLPARERRTLSRVGYMPDITSFPTHLDAKALLSFCGALAGTRPSVLRKRIPELLKLVGLEDRVDEPIGQFSRGMLQRLGLAQALFDDPDLLVLDEPTEGLDLPGRHLLADVVRDRGRLGKATLLITHNPQELGELCSRVLLLMAGRLIHDGPTAGLLSDQVTTIGSALRRVYSEASA